MIKAILPVPNRVYTPGSIYVGEQNETVWDSIAGNECTIRYGRNIRVPPLAFYLVYTVWNGYLISHTFMTDETLDPRSLEMHRNMYTGGVERTPPVLVPISVTYGKPGCVTETYLFTRSIDFLLSNYRLGYPLRSCCSITLPTARPIYPDTPDRIPVGLYRGLAGIVEYLDLMLKIVGNTDIGQDFNRWCPPKVPYELIPKVTPERPDTIVNLLRDMVYYEKNQDGLFDMIDSLIGLNAKEDPRSLLEEFLFRGQYDPVTMLCLNTPSYLTIDALLPYLEDPNLACGYYDMACSDVYLSEHFRCSNLFDYMAGFEEQYITSLMEFFYHVPYTDVTIYINRYQEQPTLTTYDRFGVFQTNDMIFSELFHYLTNTFLNWKIAPVRFDEITLSKTWLGEVMIHAQRGSYQERYYVNLNLYHLISPSLVNRERLESVLGISYTL